MMNARCFVTALVGVTSMLVAGCTINVAAPAVNSPASSPNAESVIPQNPSSVGSEMPPTSKASDSATAQDGKTFIMPDLVGDVLQDAQDELQVLGSNLMTQTDPLGGRIPVLDRGWQVCEQEFAAGEVVSLNEDVELFAVRLSEECPIRMPNLVDMNLQAAQDQLQSLGSRNLSQLDASGEDRVLLVDSNWKVCVQDPRAGSWLALDKGVTLRSVKNDEECP